VLSIGSIGSAGSVLSIGSAGSVLSIGSAGAIGSAMSAGSLWSIMSAGAMGRVLGRRVARQRGPVTAGPALAAALVAGMSLSALARRR
jgi:hypothetical protein